MGGEMEAPGRVVELVEVFGRNIDAYRSGRYNETQVRREFIDPLFECLGWDVGNKQGWAEAYKDVVHEDAEGGRTRGLFEMTRMSGILWGGISGGALIVAGR